eukprot:1862356-Alexandrium_andersonii.AAC.1
MDLPQDGSDLTKRTLAAKGVYVKLPWATVQIAGDRGKGHIFTPSQVVYHATNPTDVGNLRG